MVSRDPKRLSLPFNLLSPKKGKPSPQRKLYISKPMGAIGPTGDSVGVHSDETVVPLRVYCEIFGPSVLYKSVGVKLGTTVLEVISDLLLKLDRMGGEGSMPEEFCMAEMSLLSDFSYIRILDDSTPPLSLFQRHSKRYGSSDSWRLKLILKSQISSIPSLFLTDYLTTQAPDLKHITVDCNCLEETYLSVTLPISPSISCEKVINKIISEFAFQRQPYDFSLHCFAHPVLQNDPIPDSTRIELLQKICRQDIMELYLKYKYDDIVNEHTHSVNINDCNKLTMAAEVESERLKVDSSENSNSVEDSWVEFYDPVKDKVYYINSETEEIRWLHPTTNQETYLDTDLPPGWVRGVDEESSRIYYRNTFDKKIEWSHPLRHLQRIYKHSLQPIGNTSLPRPSIPQSDRPPVPKSSRPVLPTPPFSQEGPNLSLCGKKSRSLHSSSQSFADDLERSSSDALLTDSLTGAIVSPSRIKAFRKNKKLNNLKRFLVNDKTTDTSDNASVGSGHKIKSLFTPLSRAKRVKDPNWTPDVIVNVTPDHSPFCRKKSAVSGNSTDSIPATMDTSNPTSSQGTDIFNDSSFFDGDLAALQSSLSKEQDDTSRFSNILSELAHSTPLTAPAGVQAAAGRGQDQTAGSALDEAFSLLDSPSSGNASERKAPALVIENQNIQTPLSEASTTGKVTSEELLNDCFERISDSSFDEGSGEELIQTTEKCSVPVPIVANSEEIEMEGKEGKEGEEGENAGREDDLIGSSSSVSELKVSAKVALFEQKLSGVENKEDMSITDRRAAFTPRDQNGNSNIAVSASEQESRDRTESAVSSDSVSGESIRTEDSEGVGVSRSRNKLRTKKGRMSRNTSALDHQELEQLNKGVEPQKSILKHSRSDADDRIGRREKGVTFLTSSIQMIEIDRLSNSDTSQSSEFDIGVHRKGDTNWRNKLKSFYDEVDKQDLIQFTKNETRLGMGELVWSPDEGVGLVEEDIQGTTELIGDEILAEEVQHENKEEGELKNSVAVSSHKGSLLSPKTRPPTLPPRPTSADIADLLEFNSNRSPDPPTPKQEAVPLEEIAEQREESGGDILTATDSMLQDLTGIVQDMTSMVEDAACVVDRNKAAATEQQLDRCNRAVYNSYMCQDETGDNSAIADSGMFSLETSTNLEDSMASPYKGMPSPGCITDKLSSIHSDAPVADEAVVVSSLVEPVTPNAMVPLDVFRPKERSLLKENLIEPAQEETTPPPLLDPVAISVPSLHAQIRPSSPVLVAQLNKPLSDTAFIHGYQYHGKPTNKSDTLHSGYLALVRQNMDSSERQAKQQGKKAKQLYTETI